MCPCPGTGKGMTQLILDGIQDAGDYDKYVLGLFEKNLAVEGTFQSQMQRYYMNENEKLVSEEVPAISLRLVVQDDKVDDAMVALDGQQMSLKSTDFKISPLLKGKTEYQNWLQSTHNHNKMPSAHSALQAADDDDEEGDDEE